MILLEQLFYVPPSGNWYKEEIIETYGLIAINSKALENTLNGEQQALFEVCEMYIDELIDLVEKANLSHGSELALKLMRRTDNNTDIPKQ